MSKTDMALIFIREDDTYRFKVLYRAAETTKQGLIYNPMYTIVLEEKKSGKRHEFPLTYGEFKELLDILSALEAKDIDDITTIMRTTSIISSLLGKSEGGEVM